MRTFLEASHSRDHIPLALKAIFNLLFIEMHHNCASLIVSNLSVSVSTDLESWPCYRQPYHEFQHCFYSIVFG